jgi:DNA polymerase epsilon subunit 1
MERSYVSIQVFQAEVFKRFLDGGNLEECYESVAAVANLWLDVLVSENKFMVMTMLLRQICLGKQASSECRAVVQIHFHGIVEAKGIACALWSPYVYMSVLCTWHDVASNMST